MEPRQAGPGGNLERQPVQTGEFQAGTGGEYLPNQSHERLSPQAEVGAVQAEVAQLVMPTLPTPVIATTDDASQTNDATQLIAADVDLIEKEWIDKAKKIISETKDDPYAREKAINQLQTEYIQKRYGRVTDSAGG